MSSNGAVGVPLTLDDFDTLGGDIPLLANIMPSGEYLMEDPQMTEAVLNYLEEGKTGDRVRSQKYTVDFIDYCLRLL